MIFFSVMSATCGQTWSEKYDIVYQDIERTRWREREGKMRREKEAGGA